MPGPLDWIFWAIILAIVFVLVRPGSKAGTAIAGLSTALIALVGETTGAGGGNGSGGG
jgi:hypothetical protein